MSRIIHFNSESAKKRRENGGEEERAFVSEDDILALAPAVLADIRAWLKEGALIRASDPAGPVLEVVRLPGNAYEFVGNIDVIRPAPEQEPDALPVHDIPTQQ